MAKHGEFRASVKKVGSKCAVITTGSEFKFGGSKGAWDTFDGRKLTFKVCAIGGGLQIMRGGRRGGVRSVTKNQGGMVACNAAGAQSTCIRAKSLSVHPGGGAKVRNKWDKFAERGGKSMLLAGLGSPNGRKHRGWKGKKRRYGKRR